MTLFLCVAQLRFEFYPPAGDPKVTDVREKLFLVPGVTFRLTRNLDKDRGFVNGAVGRVLTKLDEDKRGSLRKSMTFFFGCNFTF